MNDPVAVKHCGLSGRRLLWLAMLCLIVVSGCAVGPDFKPESMEVPAGWTGPLPEGQPATDQELARWWELFQDQELTALVERGISANLDLKAAEARVRQARGARGVATAGLGPTLSAGGSFQRSQSPGATIGGVDVPGPRGDQYQAGFDALWELDIFGGVRRAREAAEADYQAAIEDRRDVLVSLTAEIARNYIDLRSLQQRIGIARRNLKAQAHSGDLTHQRFEAGFVSGLDVANSQAQTATTAARIPLLEAEARQTIHAISVLLGLEPAALITELTPELDIPLALPKVPAGVPSDLLRRRPDIRRAEESIHAATARIGVAVADYFPKFTLSGAAGVSSPEADSLFDKVSRFWSFGPLVSWELFSSGRTMSLVEQQKAVQEETAVYYRRTVLTALQEVEDTLVALEKEQEHHEALLTAVDANRRAVRLAIALYTEGQTDFLNVLQAQQALYASEDELAQSSSTVATSLVALYKAVGGGWGLDSFEGK